MSDDNQPELVQIEFPTDVESAFKHAREEERYEVGLVSGRLTSMLGSQSLLFTAWAILHGPGAPNNKWLLFGLGVAGILICLFSIFAILMALAVIRRWQELVAKMIAARGKQLGPFTVNRVANDVFHRWGLEVPSMAIPAAMLLLWVYFIWQLI